MHVVILGCGYTGVRVARRFLGRGARVTAVSRQPERLEALGIEAVRIEDLRVEESALVLHSLPPEAGSNWARALGSAPARVVYLSTTGVYGAARVVDEFTVADPTHPRVEVERKIASGPWSSLILRPAAIYGPGRGVQESIRKGKWRLGEEFVSRIQVDDLAAHCEAGLLSEVTGAFPVADEEPCTRDEIAEFCARLLSLPIPHVRAQTNTGMNACTASAATVPDRRVDGTAIRRLLGITLTYPTYRVGIPASLG